MATKKKMLQAAAGNAGGAGLNVEDVFSTYLYTGNGSSQTITNGIDLDGEGGLVWIKNRIASYHHHWYDTERGIYNYLQSSSTAAQINETDTLTAFNSDGFTLSSDIDVNRDIQDFASWTFRKAPKFFDVVTYTGDGTQGRTVSHNLGSVPGMIIVKSINRAQDWAVYHRGNTSGGDAEDWYLLLNQTSGAFDSNTHFADTAPTSTEFTVGTNARVNENTRDFVAYLFAHNDGDGEFGPDGDADIIKCGSYTGNGSGTAGPTVDLGFEPQWILTKRTDSTGYWTLVDAMRGMVVEGDDKLLYPNTSDAEQQSTRFVPSATGFQVNSTNAYVNASGGSYIYIAIRRGTKVPESGTEVFAADDETYTNLPQFYSGWPVDFALRRLGKDGSSQYTRVIDRLRGNKYLNSASSASEASLTIDWDVMDGFSVGTSSEADDFSWMWKRAPGFFDVVAYTGNGTAGRTVSHNLTVAPEMIWVKRRDSAVNWLVQPPMGSSYHGSLNLSNSFYSPSTLWGSTDPTATSFTVGSVSAVNLSGGTYIAYLFATLDGISKVGSYTGNGTSQTIDCGFTSGARFILVKRTDSTGDWYVWDTERGIVAGNDPHLSLNTTDAEVTSDDSIDPDSSGFIVNQVAATNINVSSASYIFYAIA